jgi:hypothetical protein
MTARERRKGGGRVNLKAMGKAGLSGWQEKVGARIAAPVAERTRLTEDEVMAVIGGVFLLLSLYQFFVLIRKVMRAAREVD